MQQYGESSNLSVQLAGPFGSGGAAVKLTEITLTAADWKGAESPFSQTVTVEGISVGSRVDLQPDVQLLQQLCHGGIALMAENEEGVVTVYAIGSKPAFDCTMQASVVEVVA